MTHWPVTRREYPIKENGRPWYKCRCDCGYFSSYYATREGAQKAGQMHKEARDANGT